MEPHRHACAGEKLSESQAGDVRKLCNTLLNCYLTQLLETGTLHADPHPGNLIRTPDGKICILDFGLMTDVTPQQSMALVEYISHLSVQARPSALPHRESRSENNLGCLKSRTWYFPP